MARLPRKGHDFPRRDVNVTPGEELYDTTRILGGRSAGVRIERTEETVVHQPRVESTQVMQSEQIVRHPVPKFPLDIVRLPDHIDPSRNAETFNVTFCDDVSFAVPPPTPDRSITLGSFSTLEGFRTMIRHINVQVFDSIFPVDMNVRIKVNGEIQKIAAQVPVAGAALFTPVAGGDPVDIRQVYPSSLGFVDLTNNPDNFHNVVFEIPNNSRVDIDVKSTVPATRRVCVTLWGWVEDVTRMSETLFR